MDRDPHAANLTVLLAAPRGFCAGVDRAIQIVERALERWGRPVYVRHEIVHNRVVVESLEARGAIFVDELDAVPDDRPVVFSAHGVPKAVPAEARRRNLIWVDATCPLVTKVHAEAEHHHAAGRHVVLIGHAGHPEVVGTMGQLPAGAVTLVESEGDVARLAPPDPSLLAWVTQTTLSVDDTAAVAAALRRRFPAIVGPRKDDICDATTTRQAAVKALARRADAILVVGAPTSSNSRRLVEVARQAGCARAALVQRAAEIDWSMFGSLASLGVTAGASAPEELVDEILRYLHPRHGVEPVKVTDEDEYFPPPRNIRELQAAIGTAAAALLGGSVANSATMNDHDFAASEVLAALRD